MKNNPVSLSLYQIIPSANKTPYKIAAIGPKMYIAVKITKSSVVFHVYETPLFDSSDKEFLIKHYFNPKPEYYTLSVSCSSSANVYVVLGVYVFLLLERNIWITSYPNVELLK